MRWVLHNTVPQEEYNKFPEVDQILLQLLFNRGIKDKEAIEKFLHATDFTDPYLFPEMEKCVDRILMAQKNQEKVLIHGDYDVDGITSSAIMYLYLTRVLGISNVEVYIPNRLDEGYGLSKNTVERCIKEQVDLIITVDCGIKDVEVVAMAIKAGIAVIITDHHTPGPTLPEASAIIHPKDYVYHTLSGAGVAFKITQALDIRLEIDSSKDFVDLAGLGTVCDIMELRGENRIIVKKAVEKLKETNRPGLDALLTLAGIAKNTLETYHLGYIIGPRLNASGRLTSAQESLKLLVTTSEQEARESAMLLHDINKQRQDAMGEAIKKGLQEIVSEGHSNVIYLPGISVGIIGLVAGKITESTNRPSIVLTDDSHEGILSGSCRSVDDFDITKALDSMKELFISYGGHKKAAGLKLKKEHLLELQEKMDVLAKQELDGKSREKRLDIDMELSMKDLDLFYLYNLVQLLEPYGETNPRPVFLSHVLIVSVDHMGENGKHLRLKLRQNDDTGIIHEAVAFNMGEKGISRGEQRDIVYNVHKNVWNNKEKFQINIIDIT